MLATFVIGLREGLEAALIVGIVAAFLKKNGHRLTAMWFGVGAGIAISIAVGVALKVIESNLPQRQQEMMETVIGGVAVVFVTGMIIWMSKHARGLKRQIESAAQSALGAGTSRAMVTMAFLAVLKEGFESAVFLLATFQAATNTGSAIAGAALGIGCSVLLGIGLYTGGVSIDLGKFFKGTSAFLILIAAGLVVSALRTAHEAGWLNAGQQRTLDLHWLAPVGSIRSAVFTGVLGIPADPRLIEVLGWFVFVIPMTLIVFWPAAHRPSAIQGAWLKLAAAGTCAVAAIAAFLAAPSATLATAQQVPVVDDSGAKAGTIRLSGNTLHRSSGAAIALQPGGRAVVAGVPTQHLTGVMAPGTDGSAPKVLTLAQVTALNGSRVPVGMDPSVNPGPYDAAWHMTDTLDVWTSHGRVYDANRTSRTSVTLTGGGLNTARTLTIAPGTNVPAGVSQPAGSWSVAASYADDFSAKLNQFANERSSANFWGRVVPLGLLLAAAALVIVALRSRRRPLTAGESASGPTPHPSRSSAHA